MALFGCNRSWVSCAAGESLFSSHPSIGVTGGQRADMNVWAYGSCTFPSKPILFAIHADQVPAKDARGPFELGDLTRNTDDKYFGVKVFVSLATLFQAPKADDDEEGPSQGTSLIPRVSRTGALAQLCGPYSELLYAIMGGITRMMKKLTPVGVLVPAIVSGPFRSKYAWLSVCPV